MLGGLITRHRLLAFLLAFPFLFQSILPLKEKSENKMQAKHNLVSLAPILCYFREKKKSKILSQFSLSEDCLYKTLFLVSCISCFIYLYYLFFYLFILFILFLLLFIYIIYFYLFIYIILLFIYIIYFIYSIYVMLFLEYLKYT